MLFVTWWMLATLAQAGVTVTLPSSDAAVVFDDSSEAAVEQGLTAMGEGRYEAAGRAFRALADAGGGADAHLLEAGAWYEAGQLRLAEKAVKKVLAEDPARGPALGLLGLILTDTGRGEEALEVLARAGAAARSAGDRRLEARTLVNEALVRLDRGELDQAEGRLDAAAAVEVDDAGIREAIRENRAALASVRGEAVDVQADTLSTVSGLLRRGQVDAARKTIPIPSEHDRRASVRALLADALCDRASGNFDAANVKLRTALSAAREGGLLRESAAALTELGVLYSLAGRFDTSLATLQEAVGLVAGTSFRLREVATRVEAGRVAVRLGDLQQARDQLAAASVVAGQTQDPLGEARISELRGEIASRGEDPVEAAGHYRAARATYVARGHHADAARVATDLVRLYAGVDAGQVRRWSREAEQSFQAAGNAAGPAHVKVAEGLGYARRNELDAALAAFLEGAKRAEGLGTDRGRQIAVHARENAAQALKALGHTEELADEMAQATELGGVMERQEAFAAAEARYDEARASFDRGDYATARTGFDQAVSAFRNLGETGYAGTARRGRGWASRNLALRLEPEPAIALYRLASEDGKAVGDAELHAKALVGLGLASAQVDARDAIERLTEGAAVAEAAGLDAEAGTCFAEIAAKAQHLDVRAAAARRALDLRGPEDAQAVYAMYSVAVDAYNAGAHQVALELADEIAPHAGKLDDAVASVREAAAAALEP